jgi:3D (Asp-Asp-Asp) domain-containing protein
VHFPAPRSCSGNASPSENWTASFLPGRTVGARWRWFLIIGTIIACAFFPVGISSNAANQNQDEKPSAATIEAETTPTSQTSSEANAGTDKTDTTQAETNSSAPSEQDKTSDSRPVAETAVPTAAPSVSPPDSTVLPRPVTLRVVVDGKARTMQVSAGQTLGRALLQGGLPLDKLDRVTPDVKTLVKHGQTVRITTVRTRLETRAEKVAPGFLVQISTKIAPGKEQVVQYGKSGTAKIIERVVYVGGKRVRKSFVSRTVAVPAQDKIIALGSDSRFMPRSIPYHKRYARAFQTERVLAARGGSARSRLNAAPDKLTLRPVRSLIVKTSAYAAGPAGGSLGNYTATGMRCVRGAVATDPRVIPLGTKLYIEGYGYAFACDTGGAIKGKRIDLAFNSVRECFQHGRRTARVWILSE